MAMMTARQIDEREEKLKIPLDLSEWCEKSALLSWIQEELQTLDWANPQLVSYLRAHPGYQPRMLLCLLAFAYSTGVFESEEILRLCYADEMFRGICNGPVPSLTELGRFRRENRGLFKWLLTQLFRRALREKFVLGETLLPAGLRQFLAETANVRLDIARHVDRAGHGA